MTTQPETRVIPTPPPSYADLPAAPAAYHRTPTDGRRRRHRTPLAWLPWALLGAIALLCLLSLLVASVAGDDDSGAARGTAASSSDGRLTSGGADVLATGALRGHVGQAATGSSVRVASVVSDEAFWVGSGSQQVLVHLTPSARGTDGESPFQVRAGQSIDLTGTVKRASAGTADELGITAAEGADRLASAGALIEATRVALSS